MKKRKLLSIFSIVCLSGPILLNHMSLVQAEGTISSTTEEKAASDESRPQTSNEGAEELLKEEVPEINNSLTDGMVISDTEEPISEGTDNTIQSDTPSSSDTEEIFESSIEDNEQENNSESMEEDNSDPNEGIELHRDNYENGWTYQVKNNFAVIKSCDLSGVVTFPASLGGKKVAIMPNGVGSTNSNLGRIFKNKDSITELNILNNGYKVEFISTATGGTRSIQDWLLSDFPVLRKANLSGLGALERSAKGTFKNCPNLRFLDLTGWFGYNGTFSALDSWFWGTNNGDVYNPKIPLLIKTDNSQLLSYNYDQNGRMPFPLNFSAADGSFADNTKAKKFLNSVAINNLDVTNNDALVNSIKSFANSQNPTRNGYKFLGFKDNNGRWLQNETDAEYILNQSYTAQYQQFPWTISTSGTVASITDYIGNKEQNLEVPTLDEIKILYPGMYDNCNEVQITKNALQKGANNAINFSISHNGSKVKLSGTDLSETFLNNSTIQQIDLSNLDTSNVTDMNSMFGACGGLTTLNVSNFDTSNVTNMSNMFAGCNGLTTLNVSNFDTSNVTDMNSMFGACGGLTTLNVSNFDTSNVMSMNSMFFYCNQLSNLDLSNFTILNKADIQDMFFVDNPTLLLVKVSAPRILYYSYNLDNRFPYPLEFNANGGVFDDGMTSKKYFSDCGVEPKNATIQAVKDYANNLVLTRPGYAVTDWQDPQGVSLNQATDFNQILTNTYSAQWGINLNPTPPAGSERPNGTQTSGLGIAYYPIQMSTDQTNLTDSGQQEIPFKETTGFHAGVRDVNSNVSWELTAQLTWQGKGLEGSYIQVANSNGEVTSNKNDGVSAPSPGDLEPTTEVVGSHSPKITDTPIKIMEAPTTNNRVGVYDYALGDAKLIIPETRAVQPSNYTGIVNWNLVKAP
ncbi:BspA family leucine-rich repeat surface protein [Enterococcus faecalis]|nr:BspA family leucine-rich repeat surface protein [Enterococcus faecalis]